MTPGLALLWLSGCRTPEPPPGRADTMNPAHSGAPAPAWSGPETGRFVLRGGIVAGQGAADVEVAEGRIVTVGAIPAAAGLEEVSAAGLWIAPAFIDSHVHLAYLPRAAEMARGGIAAAVDLAAPLSFLADHPDLPRMILSGPMVTAVGGYPVQGWGRGGYGVECADAAAAVAAVQALVAAGAGAIKLPVTSAPVLDRAALTAAAAEAHRLQVPVVSHALSDADARLAAEIGADVLAHTPVELLEAATLEAWRGRAVISTLRAFGGSPDTLANLRALSAQTTVLYGTDYGNTSTAGIDGVELSLMREAGLTPAQILAAGTAAPAGLWGLADLGAVAPGREADLLLLAGDPLQDITALAQPVGVLIHGAAPR